MHSVVKSALKFGMAIVFMVAASCLLIILNRHHPVLAMNQMYATPHVQGTPPAMPKKALIATNSSFGDLINTIIGAVATIIATIIAAIIGVRLKPKKARVAQSKHTSKTSTRQQKYILEHIKNYCRNVQENPRISQLQVLGMTRPLKIEDIYVHLRLYTNHMLSYELDEELHAVELGQDPAHHIEAERRAQERRLQEGLDPDKAIRQHKRSIIVGDPGAGKTTLLRYLTMKAIHHKLQNCPHIPIYIELSTFVPDKYNNLFDLIVDQWIKYDSMDINLLRQFLEQKMRSGDILLLLDGLDETAVGKQKELAERAYVRTTQLIQALVDNYPRLSIVVAVRKATYHNQCWPHLQGFDELELVEFTPMAIKTFARNWFEASKSPNQERMIRDFTFLLEHNSRIEELASNPLLLSLIVLVYKQRLELPEHRAQLYERCVETLLTYWDAERSIDRIRIFSADHKLKLLKVIAWHFHDRGIRYFPEQELLEIIARFLPTINLEPEQNKEILSEIVQAHGLIKEQAQGLYGFSHMTFQEYFVARYIDDYQHRSDSQFLNALLARIDKPWWEEVLLLYAGITPDASPLLRTLLDHCTHPEPQELLFHTHLLHAGHCLATAPVVNETQVRETIVDLLFHILETTPYVALRKEIALILARIGGKSINRRLLQRLLSPHPDNLDVSKNIADALGASGNQALANELLTLLSNMQVDHFVRAHISLALARLGEHSLQIRDKLLALLANPAEDWYVRLRLADALGDLGDPTVAHGLLRILKQHNSADSMYYGIAISLGKLGNREVIPDLLELLKDRRFDGYVHGGIVNALCMMIDRDIVKQFITLLKDEDVENYVRRKIAKALGELEPGYVSVTDLLGVLTSQSINPEVRGEVSTTLCALGEQSAIPTLLRLLEDHQLDHQFRISIVSTLGCLAAPAVLEHLHPLLKDQQLPLDLRSNILSVLSMAGESSALSEMLAFFKDSTFSLVCPKVQINMIKTFSHLGQGNLVLEQDIIQLLLQQLKDKRLNVYVGRSITDALDMFHLQRHLPELLDLLSDRVAINPYIRQGIAKLIARCEQDEQTLQRLSNLLQETDIRDDIFDLLWKVGRQTKPLIQPQAYSS